MTALGSSIAEYGRVAINIYITLGCGTTHTHHTHHTAHFDTQHTTLRKLG